MILTVTLNAAVDVTYELDSLAVNGDNRVRQVRHRAGGKGVNVARLLHSLGREVMVSGLAGGPTGEALEADLSQDDVQHSFEAIANESRRTLTVVCGDSATLFNEPGPRIEDREWHRYREHFATLVRDADVVVLSGSLPPGVPVDAYAVLGEASRAVGVPVVLDADGRALTMGLSAQPVIVKPNQEELARATGSRVVTTAIAALRRRGAENVVASLGEEGLLADTTEGVWRAHPPVRVAGNPTGAGDAVVAALTCGVADKSSWPQRLREAIALSSAAVLEPVAGRADLGAYRRIRHEATIEKVDL
jgi:tagatose 6-phosphate kinase